MALSIIGCGFVADLYMRSLKAHPTVQVSCVYDHDPERAQTFAQYWGLIACDTMEGFLAQQAAGSLVLNLTNPAAHYDVSRQCLEAGMHVYSEKPLAMSMVDATALTELARARNLMLASAPCSVLGQAAQTLGKALRDGVAGKPRLIYAELDDGYIPQAPFDGWRSESGRAWPAADEFRTGCTVEHAGYYLTWLIGWFGSVERVIAASATVIPEKNPDGQGTPDVSIATLFFANGVVARLTCSIVGSHDHQIRIFGDKGVLRVTRAWDNAAPVRFYRRFQLRRRLVEHPIGRRIKLGKKTHPKVKRWGAAAMNFALGPVEMLEAISEGRECRLSADFALHLNEVTLAIQGAGSDTGAQVMQTKCDPVEPMSWAK